MGYEPLHPGKLSRLACGLLAGIRDLAGGEITFFKIWLP